MHVPANAPSLLAANEILAAAQHRDDDWPALGLIDTIELNTVALTHEQMVEVIVALAGAIENLVAAPGTILASARRSHPARASGSCDDRVRILNVRDGFRGWGMAPPPSERDPHRA